MDNLVEKCKITIITSNILLIPVSFVCLCNAYYLSKNDKYKPYFYFWTFLAILIFFVFVFSSIYQYTMWHNPSLWKDIGKIDPSFSAKFTGSIMAILIGLLYFFYKKNKNTKNIYLFYICFTLSFLAISTYAIERYLLPGKPKDKSTADEQIYYIVLHSTFHYLLFTAALLTVILHFLESKKIIKHYNY